MGLKFLQSYIPCISTTGDSILREIEIINETDDCKFSLRDSVTKLLLCNILIPHCKHCPLYGRPLLSTEDCICSYKDSFNDVSEKIDIDLKATERKCEEELSKKYINDAMMKAAIFKQEFFMTIISETLDFIINISKVGGSLFYILMIISYLMVLYVLFSLRKKLPMALKTTSNLDAIMSVQFTGYDVICKKSGLKEIVPVSDRCKIVLYRDYGNLRQHYFPRSRALYYSKSQGCGLGSQIINMPSP